MKREYDFHITAAARTAGKWVGGQTIFDIDTGDGWVVLEDGSYLQIEFSGARLAELRAISGERNIGATNNYLASVPECNYLAWAHGDGDVIVTANPALLFGVLITSTLTGDFAVRNGQSAAGALLLTTATDAAVANFFQLPGIKCDSGIFIDDNATGGSAIICYRDQ